MPLYNAERFLEKALDSLLVQTFRDFELIISDNASTDRTYEICQHYTARDARIHYVRNDRNMGAGWNLRRVCALATGKYFKWAAHDDFCAPTFLQRCVELLETDPSLVLAHSGTRVVDETGMFLENYDWPMKTDSPNTLTRFRELLMNDHMCYQIFGLIRMDALRRVPPQGSYVNSDGVLLAQLGLIGRFYEIPEFLFISTRHTSQSCKTVPARVSEKRLRLTSRYGVLPPPEWWDPQKRRRITFPEWRMFREYFLSIVNAPLRFSERLRAYLLLCRWVKKHYRRMIKDLLIAADQVLYILQTLRPATTEPA
jgi:glycosyltransferase involved in cell wall biosynthesis